MQRTLKYLFLSSLLCRLGGCFANRRSTRHRRSAGQLILAHVSLSRFLCSHWRSLFFFLLTIITAGPSSAQPVEDPNNYYPENYLAPFPSGALGRPFGESVVVQGKVVADLMKFDRTDGRLLVQKINGVATQQGLVLRFQPITPQEYWESPGKFGHPTNYYRVSRERARAMLGKTFELRGYELGEHSGMNLEETLIQTPIQKEGFGFRLKFQPLMLKEIPDIHFTPADFENRLAEFEGVAVNWKGKGSLMHSNGWFLQLHTNAWPAASINQGISARGKIVKSPNGIWRMAEPDYRLIDLGDQVGKEVTLDGMVWNERWHAGIRYRGEEIYVENLKNLPGWTNSLSHQLVTIKGVLDRARLPDRDKNSQPNPPLREQYIVRQASWSLCDLSWRKPPEPPKAPRLTLKILKDYGITLKGGLKERFEEHQHLLDH